MERQLQDTFYRVVRQKSGLWVPRSPESRMTVLSAGRSVKLLLVLASTFNFDFSDIYGLVYVISY
jgi:hypothetical protein